MSLSTTINVALDADLRRIRDLTTTQAIITGAFQKTLVDGTGINQANIVIAKKYVIIASGTQVIDMGSGGLTDDLGSAVTFTAIKAIMIKPAAANSAAVQVEPNVSEGFADWVKAAGDGVKIPAGGLFLFAAPEGAGLGVTDNTDDKLLLTNLSGAASATVDVVLLGVGTLS